MQTGQKGSYRIDDPFPVWECMFPREYLTAFLSSGIRPDGRKLHGGREVILNLGSVSTANGSALLRFGDTLVVCGVKAEVVVATPTSFNTPIVCSVEVPPSSSSAVSAGPPTTPTQSITQTLQSTLLRCIDTEQLVISEDKFHWVLYVDVMCLCDDGNLLDSACFAATAALTTRAFKSLTVFEKLSLLPDLWISLLAATHKIYALLPSVDCSTDTEVPVVSLKHKTSLKLTKTPIFVSFALLSDGSCLLDPDLSEEELADGAISICFADGAIIHLAHTGKGVASDHILSLVKVAQGQAQNLIKLLHETIQ